MSKLLVILKSLGGLAPEAVIPAKAGIQVLQYFLHPGLRRGDLVGSSLYSNSRKLSLNEIALLDKPAEGPIVESVITFENCYNHIMELLPVSECSPGALICSWQPLKYLLFDEGDTALSLTPDIKRRPVP